MSRARGKSTGAEAPPAPWTLPIATVHTKSFLLAQTIATTAVTAKDPMIAGFFGDPGTGKTHALQHFCANSGVESIYVTASTSPQRKEIYEEILLATTAQVPDDSSRGLRRRCNEVLAERRRILVVDEAQNLTLQWHNQLRNLHDEADADFALLLAGGTNAARTLQRDQQLWSRVAMRTTFEALGGQELLNVLAELHPVLANTEDSLLMEIDARDCTGNLRNWTSVLKLALPLVGQTSRGDRFTPQVVRGVFALRGTR
jgi:DNA transposition AAA+ family ATPase